MRKKTHQELLLLLLKPGELSSSDDEMVNYGQHKVQSKVVRANKQQETIGKRSGMEKFSHLRSDPDFKQFLSEIVDERMNSSSKQSSKQDKQQDKQQQHRRECNDGMNINIPRVQLFKSPSDTTIYSPGLCKISAIDQNDQTGLNDDMTMIDKISNFVENIRIGARTSDRRGKSPVHSGRSSDRRWDKSPVNSHEMPRTSIHTPVRNSDTRSVECSSTRSRSTDREQQQPNWSEGITDQLLVQAEKFQAKIEAPKGNYNFGDMLLPYNYDKLRNKFVKPEGLAPLDNEILFLRNFDQDDEFFHITSQIDPAL